MIVNLIQQGKTEEQITAERAWYNTEQVWLVHKEGFSMGQYQLQYSNVCIHGSFLNSQLVNVKGAPD